MSILLIVSAVIAGIVAIPVAIKKGFFNKKVFIYGMKAARKTTFHTYCATGDIIKEYCPTGTGDFQKAEIQEKTKSEWKKWITRGWSTIDSAGQDYTNRELKEIKDHIEEADSVLYFFRADEIANTENRSKVLRTIKANILKYKEELEDKLILVATHTDLLPNFNKKISARDWEKDPVLQNIIRLSHKHRIEYVSLSPSHIAKSTKQILDLVREEKR